MVKDQRFSWAYPPRASDDLRRTAAERFIARVTNLGEIQTALSAWWGTVNASPEDENPSPLSFLRPLQDEVAPELMAVLERLGDEGHDEPEAAPYHGAYLLAAPAIALATAAARPSITAFRRAVRLFRSAPFFAQTALEDRFCEAVASDPNRLRVWVSELSRMPPEIIGYMTLGREEDVLRSEPDAWLKAADPFRIWHFDRARLPKLAEPFDQLHLLRRLDRTAWLAAVEGMWSPRLTYDAIHELEVLQDSDLLKNLLATSAPVFDEQGRWTRNVAAVVLAGMLLDHAVALRGAVAQATRDVWTDERASRREEAVRELDALEQTELSTFLYESYRILLARSDGRRLAYGVLYDLLIRWISTREPALSSGWSGLVCAIAALARALADMKVKVSEQYESWKAREEIAVRASVAAIMPGDGAQVSESGEGRRLLLTDGFPALFVSTLILLWQEKESRSVELGLWWTWLEELLVGRDKGLSSLGRFAELLTLAEVTKRLGALLSELPNPSALWDAAYRKLEPQRRRRTFFTMYMSTDADIDVPSTILFLIGFYACAARVATEAADEAALTRGWCMRIYEAIRRFFLTSSGHAHSALPIRDIVPRYFAFMPAVFGEHLGGTPTVRAVLAPFENDSLMLSWACYHLWQNGVEPDRLKKVLSDAGIDLEVALQRAKQWAGLTSGEKWEPPHALVELATALGITLD